MTAVPQSTLNWLFSVLTKDHYDPRQTYHDPNRTYHDVANALAQYPSLLPRTDVYTYETGFSALILVLTGTLPVSFRGTIYKFPVALWIPNTYPRDPPMVYVTPAQDMAVRIGQHVTLEGRVYHHYLAHWAEAWDRSSIVDLLSILREVFAKEPPVKYKQPQIPPQQLQTQTPPPVPPLPPELGPVRNSPVSSPASGRPAPVSQMPPPPPPKPGQVSPPDEQQQQQSPTGPVDSPAVPPLPPKPQDSRRFSHPHSANITSPMHRTPQHQPDRPSGFEGTTSFRQSYRQQQPQVAPAYAQGAMYSGATGSTAGGPLSPTGGAYGHEQQVSSRIPAQRDLGYYPDYQQPHAPYQQAPHQQVPRAQPQNQFQPPSTRPAPAPKTETPDLLTSPFEVELPSFNATGPAPPIPPNPEKDALLHAVSSALADTLQSNASQSESAGRSLHAQSQSLHAAVAKLRGEIASLNSLNSTLQSNTSILQQSLHRADGVIADAQSRTQAPASEAAPSGLPPIDEVLVAPTVVGKQLYDLGAEEAGIQQAIYALQAALVKGVIGVEAWSRHTRGLAREAFLKRAVIRKIGRGMGLEEH